MRVLIIEDNKELALLTRDGLCSMGFQVDVTHTAEAGFEKAFINEYNVILLDLNLPDQDGLALMEEIKKERKDVPIIIITARIDVDDRIAGLDLGADDYISKPFQLIELRARIQAVIRRSHGRASANIEIGLLRIEPASRKVYYHQQEILLKVKEFDVLEYLAEKHPQIISSEEIAEHIYDESYNPFSSVLRVHISRLKHKLCEAQGAEMLISTRGKGYSLCIKEM